MVLVVASSHQCKETIQTRKTSCIYLNVIEITLTLFIRIFFFFFTLELSSPFFSTPVSASATPEPSSTQNSVGKTVSDQD